jgi:glycosyltransferase involved in cell wall biosynthesis
MKKSEKDIRVAIVFKNFASWTGLSHIGLNVAALTNARVLNQNGIHATVFPVKNNIDLVDAINEYNREHEVGLTHVVISAPWLSRRDMEALIQGFPQIQFAVESHSNVGFLQADPQGMRVLREVQELARLYPNIKTAGNSARFVDWMRLAYSEPVALLPNLYPLVPVSNRHWDGKRTVKIGIFGAVRPQKNFMTAAAAAVAMYRMLNVGHAFIPVELHMSCGGEGDGGNVSYAITELCAHIPGFTLIRHSWGPWEEFIELIAQMDIMLQPSYTESFNMITADGIFVGVPSVVSTAITWVPKKWQADSDDALGIARVGVELLRDPSAAKKGLKALKNHNEYGIHYWKLFFGV